MAFIFLLKMKEWCKQHLWLVAVVSVGGVICLIAFVWWRQPVEEPLSVEMMRTSMEETTHSETTTISEDFYVDIKGEVNDAGVYLMTPESRVQDVVTKAGGFTEDADQTKINLAQKISDQMIIVVPKKGESANSNISLSGATDASSLVNLNTASVEELQKLKGIGRKKAELIIRYRQEHGSFQRKEDLLKVKGIGKKGFEELKEQVTAP